MITEILTCPGCNSNLLLTGDEWTCPSCGLVAIQRSNIIDFLYNTPHIKLANNGLWDLSEDQRTGVELLRLSETHGYSELKNQARALRTSEGRVIDDPHAQLLDSRLAKLAQRRFNRRYELVSSEVGRKHGQQMLHKIETRLRDLDLPSVSSELAIELGGGDGQYLLGFAEKFRHVLVVDGSLVNLALASALARDDGITNASFLRADITALPVKSSIASMTHANGVIEHVYDTASLVAETVRLRSEDGYSVVVSPNRTPITFEPHFRLPLFGLIPRFIRTPMIGVARGKASEAGTDLLTLRRFRQTLQRTGTIWDVFVIPRGINSTARQTPVRSIVARSMQSVVGAIPDKLINHIFISIAHSHIAIGRGNN